MQELSKDQIYRMRKRARDAARAAGDISYIDPLTGEELEVDNVFSRTKNAYHTRTGTSRAAHQQQAELLDDDTYEDDTEQQNSLWGLLVGAVVIGGAILVGIMRASR